MMNYMVAWTSVDLNGKVERDSKRFYSYDKANDYYTNIDIRQFGLKITSASLAEYNKGEFVTLKSFKNEK